MAYAASYAVGSVVSYLILRRLLGGLRTRRLLAFGGRLLIATGLATGLTFPVARVLDGPRRRPGPRWSRRCALVCVGAVDVLLFLVLARLLRHHRGPRRSSTSCCPARGTSAETDIHDDRACSVPTPPDA